MSIKQSNVHWICDCVSSDRESFGRMVFFELDESWSVDQLIKERHLQETLEFDAPVQTLSTASNDKLERFDYCTSWALHFLIVVCGLFLIFRSIDRWNWAIRFNVRYSTATIVDIEEDWDWRWLVAREPFSLLPLICWDRLTSTHLALSSVCSSFSCLLAINVYSLLNNTPSSSLSASFLFLATLLLLGYYWWKIQVGSMIETISEIR